jgi:hypothetical protein
VKLHQVALPQELPQAYPLVVPQAKLPALLLCHHPRPRLRQQNLAPLLRQQVKYLLRLPSPLLVLLARRRLPILRRQQRVLLFPRLVVLLPSRQVVVRFLPRQRALLVHPVF